MDIEIWSDIACPWCYVGKRRFETALERFEHRDDVTVTYRSFELDPEAPAERPGEMAALVAAKYGIRVEQARARQAELAALAAADGLDLDFETARAANTFDAHRLVHLAHAHGRQADMKERLQRAYFTDGELISDRDTLVRLAAEIGLDAEEVRTALAGDAYADAVRDDERTAAALGIQGVPMFVVDRALGASGAHPPEALLDLLRQGWEARAAAPTG